MILGDECTLMELWAKILSWCLCSFYLISYLIQQNFLGCILTQARIITGWLANKLCLVLAEANPVLDDSYLRLLTDSVWHGCLECPTFNFAKNHLSKWKWLENSMYFWTNALYLFSTWCLKVAPWALVQCEWIITAVPGWNNDCKAEWVLWCFGCIG